jgi:hypothetical protein
MGQKLRIEGIYDQRTLKHLKQKGLHEFCFDFSPRSFNFIQEYVFLEQIIPLLDTRDHIFLHFARSNDPMVKKLADDLKKAGVNLTQVYFEFDEWSTEVTPLQFEYNYILSFVKDIDAHKMIGSNFKGFIFQFEFFEELHRKNLLMVFASNFLTRFHSKLSAETMMILRADWHSNLLASLFDLFEFNLLSFPINSKIEVCYRNVDLKKLNSEMEVLEKNIFSLQDF